MTAALLRLQAGERTAIPHQVAVHLVAARYGQTPDQVRAWPADDFLAALNFLGVTR